MNEEASLIPEGETENSELLTVRQKLKIGVYFLTIICGIGYISSGLYGLVGNKGSIKLSIEIVSIFYSLIGGCFVIVILLPIPHWETAMVAWFPFMYTFLGRFSFFLLMGPLLVTAQWVGLVFGGISIINAMFYIILYFMFRNSKTKKSFFRPFEADTIEKPYDWDFEYSNEGYQLKPQIIIRTESDSLLKKENPKIPDSSEKIIPQQKDYSPFENIKKNNSERKLKIEENVPKEEILHPKKENYNPFDFGTKKEISEKKIENPKEISEKSKILSKKEILSETSEAKSENLPKKEISSESPEKKFPKKENYNPFANFDEKLLQNPEKKEENLPAKENYNPFEKKVESTGKKENLNENSEKTEESYPKKEEKELIKENPFGNLEPKLENPEKKEEVVSKMENKNPFGNSDEKIQNPEKKENYNPNLPTEEISREDPEEKFSEKKYYNPFANNDEKLLQNPEKKEDYNPIKENSGETSEHSEEKDEIETPEKKEDYNPFASFEPKKEIIKDSEKILEEPKKEIVKTNFTEDNSGVDIFGDEISFEEKSQKKVEDTEDIFDSKVTNLSDDKIEDKITFRGKEAPDIFSNKDDDDIFDIKKKRKSSIFDEDNDFTEVFGETKPAEVNKNPDGENIFEDEENIEDF